MTAFEDAAQALRHKDPLLRITKGLLYAMMAIAIVVAVAMVAAIPMLWIYPSHIQFDDTTLPRSAYGAISLMLALILVMALLGIRFLVQIIAIIDSVRIGSPFVPENAKRLRRAAWSVVAIELLGFLAEPIGSWMHTVVDKGADFDMDFSFGWLVTALLLFILARVFDHGTKLAEEAEGTV